MRFKNNTKKGPTVLNSNATVFPLNIAQFTIFSKNTVIFTGLEQPAGMLFVYVQIGAYMQDILCRSQLRYA
jgi:hypothetical protein